MYDDKFYQRKGDQFGKKTEITFKHYNVLFVFREKTGHS